MNNLRRIEDEKYYISLIRTILKRKGLEISIIINPDLIVKGKIFYDRILKMLYLNFISSNSIPSKGEEVNISFFVKETCISFKTLITDVREDNIYVIKRPDIIYSSFNRLITRCRIDEKMDIQLNIENVSDYLDVIDITTEGISFKSKQKLFNQNEIIKNIIIVIKNTQVKANGVVKYLRQDFDGSYVFGINFEDLEWDLNRVIFSYIFKQNYPQIVYLNNFEVQNIYNLYNDSGYMNLKSKEEMQINFKNMISCLNILKDKDYISTSLGYLEKGELISGASILRIYNNTFLAHQLASVPQARTNIKSKIDLYLSIIDTMMNNKYFEYFLSYFLDDLSWNTEFFNNICKYIDDDNRLLIDFHYLYKYNIDNTKNASSNITNNLHYKCILLDKGDEFLHFSSVNIPELVNKAYSYKQNELFLQHIEHIYHSVGLVLKRKIFKVEYNNNLIAYAVAEIYSNGLNLFNVLDMCRVYFVNKHDNPNTIIKIIISEISKLYIKFNKNNFNLLLRKNDIENTKLEIDGLGNGRLFGRLISDKRGGSEYKKLLMMSYR